MTTYGNQLFTKISGYLEKKGRLRIGSLWKKYWFVLEGRLLLYYRSKDEYDAISPCKGTINLCPPCTIKPATATSCIFQIEGRASTVSLRAENRFEQERWMQALLTAIDQSKSSPSRLSHFRYSFDELPMPYQDNEIIQNGLQRQNSAPYNTISTHPKQDIIGRLQSIGAHTYGGSLDTITKHTPRVQQIDIFKDKPSKKMGSNRSLTLQNGSIEVIVENDQYSIIQEENSLDVIMDERNSKTIPLEQITNASLPNLGKMHIIENDQYSHSNNVTKTNETVGIRNKKVKKSESLYERISGDSNKFNAHEIRRLRRKNSNIYERISSSSSSSEKLTKLYNQYSIVKKRSQDSLQFQKEPEYSTPINLEDHNKNTLIVDNDQYIPEQDNLLNETEYYKVDPVKELEELYEDPDVIRNTSEFGPVLPPRPNVNKLDSSVESSNHSSVNENKNKRSKGLQMLAQLIKSDKKQEPNNQNQRPKKKRSTSFIHRMLRRKEKPVHTDEEIVYEVIDKDIEKPKDVNDIQMLQELQKILETRKSLLQKKLNASDTTNMDDKQNIPQTTEKVKDNSGMCLTETEDLDKEESIQDSNRKVKDLIHKFNDLHNEDEILLRKKTKSNLQRSETISGVPQTFSNLYTREDTKRDSDELTNLLNELSKVTSAPVLTPGVTCSLTTPVVSDDEWMQVIPIRYRRLSDPDYDIPRPHSSLQLKNRTKQLPKNALPATRFFGPVLPSADKISTEPQSLSSMDPDSLEIQESSLKIKNVKRLEYIINHGENYGSISSYRSHNYPKTDDVIYLQPKSILFNIKMNSSTETNSVDAENDKNSTSLFSTVTEETFIDSLEPLTESTYF